VFSGEFILVDFTAAARYIWLYSQQWWRLGHRPKSCVRYWVWCRDHASSRSIQDRPRIRITCSLQNNGLGWLYVAPIWWSGVIKKGHANIEHSNQTPQLRGTCWEASICGFMPTNATAYNGEPYPVQEPKAHHQHPSYDVTTELVTFRQSSGAWQYYINLRDGSCKGDRERITGVTSTQATMMGKMMPLALVGGKFTVFPGCLFVALPQWVRKYHCRNFYGHYLLGLVTRAVHTSSCSGWSVLS